MNSLGLKVQFGPNSFDIYDGYLAGSDDARAQDVMDMASDQNIRAIVANRGGWGCNRILPLLDYQTIKSNPKPIVGYSDLTALINAIHLKTGLITFHGPMGLDNWSNENGLYFNKVIMNGEAVTYTTPTSNLITIVGGKASGKLVGGNLSVFSSLVGSEFLYSDFSDKILFLEEVEEEPYRLDRMMMQLELSGALKSIRGFIWGRCTSCQASNPQQSQPWTSVIIEKMKKYPKTPSFIGALIGHIDQQWTLPIGINVEIDANQGTISLLEPAVQV
eukprot:TRINITY_DN9170_c0_g1_i2.p1 TRINITY_DN9170_c0_g1~~TRINITY_DN9170_c0_g1_i2.p1  ORF type:complete len:275 (-),score=44.27 TRINITY_DN9170_c0_g1_i2:69-893(-)